MEPREPEVPIEAQMPDEALDQVRHPTTPKELVNKKQRYQNHCSYL